jgi:hypothetical protein
VLSAHNVLIGMSLRQQAECGFISVDRDHSTLVKNSLLQISMYEALGQISRRCVGVAHDS